MVILGDAEIVFLALPYGKSAQYLEQLQNKKIIDLSIDHRFADGWTYGIPELHADEIAKSRYIANPGCYATSVILGLAPIAEKIKSAVITSISGISGAGLEPGEDNFLVYKEMQDHPQLDEMTIELMKPLTFTPIRIDSSERGIVSVITGDTVDNALQLYRTFYENKPFVRIVGQNESIETKKVVGTNYCDIKVLGHEKGIKVVSSLDNILKGGAGQAVQNFNIMYGLDEKAGLP